LHLVKLCVGAGSVEDLARWRASRYQPGEPNLVRTRQTPRRLGELADGGSLYWVFKGFILCRQKIVKVETLGELGAKRCEILLDPALVLTQPTPRRAFQGWRYLPPSDAPADLDGEGGAQAPADLAKRLRELGAW
ncbi:MAG: DUF1489 family protein, partial [Caulobacteraceae bacterium]